MLLEQIKKKKNTSPLSSCVLATSNMYLRKVSAKAVLRAATVR